ncbi:MAG: hypothetical protein FWD02_04440 [Bacteroidales bacterium]|nr:hypothetical protein [Bacteroidales bacterium]
MKKTALYKPLTAGFLLFLFVAFFVKTQFFTHVHIVDGIAVVHSHFYKGCHTNSPDCCGGHEHTHAGMELIDVLSEFEVLVHSFSTIVPNVDFSFHKFQSAEVAEPHTEFIDLFFLRGPPVS